MIGFVQIGRHQQPEASVHRDVTTIQEATEEFPQLLGVHQQLVNCLGSKYRLQVQGYGFRSKKFPVNNRPGVNLSGLMIRCHGVIHCAA